MNDAIRTQLSAFVDGELPENEAELLLRRVCQDTELRREAAEYFALSRMIRGEMGLAGADRLHERVAAEIEDRPFEEAAEGERRTAARAVRPLAGFAIAATVAVLAIVGLQQSTPNADEDSVAPITVVENPTPTPDAVLQEAQRQEMFLKHAEMSSAQGANGVNVRLVTMEGFSEEYEIMIDAPQGESGEDNPEEIPDNGDSEEPVAQP